MTEIVEKMRRFGLGIAASGSILVFTQNLLLLSALALLALGVGSAGGNLIFISFVLDLAGILLLGLGLLFITFPRTLRWHRHSHPFWTLARLGMTSGALCLAWFFLTVGWRVIGMANVGDLINTASGLDPESEGFSAVISSLFVQIKIVMAVWIAASLSLALGSIFFALFLKKHSGGKLKCIAWPFFCILNAAATVFLAGVIIAIAGGEAEFPLIVTAIFVKIVTVPVFGVITYPLLTWKLIKLARTEDLSTVPSGQKKKPNQDVSMETESLSGGEMKDLERTK